jgi:glycosyltransferase involved in cell wall biosynthesis
VDLINSQSARDRKALTWLAVTRRLPVPFVATRRQMPRTLLLENWLTSRMAACMIAVSRPVGEALVRRGTPRSKLAIVHNGLIAARIDAPVSLEAVEQWRSTIRWDADRRTMGIISRLKDQAVVLEALERVSTPVRLVLAGLDSGNGLNGAIERVSSRHAVVRVPFVSNIRPLYDLLELVLLPSRMEGLSQSLLEAMALGKPVVASAAAGNLDVVSHGVDGFLAAPRDPSAWAAAIEHLLADAGLRQRLGDAARHTARVHFALERTVERTASVYREVLGCMGFRAGQNSLSARV